MDRPALTVVKNNGACTLAITSLVAAGQTYFAVSSLTLTGAYAATATGFALSASPVSFQGNARLSATSFASDVVVTILISGDSSLTSTAVSPSAAPLRLVGGTVSGLSGSGLVLLNSGGNPCPVMADGSFAFTTPVAQGAAYSVTVGTSPSSPAQTCTVTNGAGSMGAAAVVDVLITCAPPV